MRRFVLVVLGLMTAAIAWAGNPHFIDVTVTREGNSLVVSGKETGLGNESQVHIVVTATAACVNPGSKRPQAENKISVSAEGDFPVQNGKAEFNLTLTPTFQPDCSPPMTIVYSDVRVCDASHDVCRSFSGAF